MELNRLEQHHRSIENSEAVTQVSTHSPPPITASSDTGLSENFTHQLLPVTRKRQILVLISSFLTICITIGFNQSYGVFQGYYVSDESSILPPSQAKSGALVAFIGTLGAGLTWGGSIVINPLMARTKDKRYITVSGVLLMSLGFGLASLATQVSSPTFFLMQSQ